MPAQVARLFTTDEYHRMGTAGILSTHDRVELIGGQVVRMSPIGIRHASCVDRLTALFAARLGKRAIVRVQNPIVLSRMTEPQPDLALLRPREDFYAERHPHPADVLLVVEVTDSSRAYDREVKLPLYARAGIPEAWVIDLGRGVLEVSRKPALRAYRERRELRRGERVALLAFPRLAFRVADMVG